MEPARGETWVRKRDGVEVSIDECSHGRVTFTTVQELVVWERPLEQFARNFRKKG